MRHNVLRELTARNLPAGKHADGQGLWLVKREREHGKWVLRVVVHGRRRETLDGRTYRMRDINRIYKEQRREARRVEQPTLFPVHEDARPPSQKTAAGRLSAPTLFD